MKRVLFFLGAFLFVKFAKGEADQIFYQKLTKFAFLSCNNQKKKKNEALIKSVEKYNPQLLLWIGDLFYSNCTEIRCLEEAYEFIKKDPFYIHMKNTFIIDGIYDDHDYNVNNGDRTYKHKEISKQKFLDYLEISKNDPRHKRNGSYISKLYVDPENENNQVKIIILDTRYNKDPYPFYSPQSGRRASVFNITLSIIAIAHCTIFGIYCNSKNDILGLEQWEWLEEQLTDSSARAHIIVSSIQIFGNGVPYENWGLMPYSLKKLKALIKKTQPKGLLFLSGDVHFAAIVGDEENIVEVTSSSVNQVYFFGKVILFFSYISSVLFNTVSAYTLKNMYAHVNYGTVDISYVDDDEIKIKTAINNSDGEEVLKVDQTFSSKKNVYEKKNKRHILYDDLSTIQCKSKAKIAIHIIVYVLVVLWFAQVLFILYKLSGIGNLFQCRTKQVDKKKSE